jgi:colicin import membrane protein
MKISPRGLIATILYHLLLLLLLVLMGLTRLEPPPGEEGILVNFGTDETGFGENEPRADDHQAGNPDLPVSDQAEEVPEDQSESVPRETYTPPEPPRETPTQDVEEVKVKEEVKPTPEELKRQREERERIEKERLEKERIEKERLEQERIEREKRAEQERIERERQAQAERLQNLGRDAFGNQGAGQNQGSEGVSEGPGNQGDINGSPDSDRYDTGGGMGNGPQAGGFGSGRGSQSLPKPNVTGCEVTSKMEITVDVSVDRDGKVISATVQKATYQDKCIWDMVVEAAMKSRFEASSNAAFSEKGWIRYIIQPR